MKFKICVPIPIKSANILEFKSRIENVMGFNPNLIEFRYDYIDDVQKITQNFITEMLDNVYPKIPVIFTFRSPHEGGKIKIDEKTRFNILKTLVLSQPHYLDIEMNTEKRMLKDILNLTNQNDVNLIFSYHNFDETPSYEVLSDQIQKFLEIMKEEFGLDSNRLEKVIFKLVCKANDFEDNLISLKICKEFSTRKMNIISFCMGTLGIFSRICCVLNGSFLTYASIVEETAPGQINVKDMRASLNLFLNRSN
ncbi:MAG: type I 3-dehydroquinate dehydratase [Candidatus Lokiarchaeota archaeon]|nr:type I 3-dehydroquinate dehydratase [Candidatus Lokiarchaeota archaeon]